MQSLLPIQCNSDAKIFPEYSVPCYSHMPLPLPQPEPIHRPPLLSPPQNPGNPPIWALQPPI